VLRGAQQQRVLAREPPLELGPQLERELPLERERQ
jgi:hypothetical protein